MSTWLEMNITVKRASFEEAPWAVLEVHLVDDITAFAAVVLTEQFTCELPRTTPDSATEVWAAVALGQIYAQFKFNRSIRKLPKAEREQVQPPLFDDNYLI